MTRTQPVANDRLVPEEGVLYASLPAGGILIPFSTGDARLSLLV
jgi:hypothetical protein